MPPFLKFLFGKLQEALDVRLNVNGEEPGAVALERLSFRSHQELLKVPGDVVTVHRAPYNELGLHHEAGGVVVWVRKFVFQVGKDGVCIFAIHLTFLANSKVGFKFSSRPHIFQAVENLFISAVILSKRCTDRGEKWMNPVRISFLIH